MIFGVSPEEDLTGPELVQAILAIPQPKVRALALHGALCDAEERGDLPAFVALWNEHGYGSTPVSKATDTVQ